MLTIEPIAYVWVCEECMLYDVGGTRGNVPDWDALLPMENLREADITPCEAHLSVLSASPCDGCGTILIGARFEYAVWNWGE